MSDEALISTYIEQNPYLPGIGDARLAGYGVPVWAIVGYLPAVRHDLARVADDYDLPEEAVRAAIAYYELHRCEIDERIAANEAPVS